jgi:hypothetical protein
MGTHVLGVVMGQGMEAVYRAYLQLELVVPASVHGMELLGLG